MTAPEQTSEQASDSNSHTLKTPEGPNGGFLGLSLGAKLAKDPLQTIKGLREEFGSIFQFKVLNQHVYSIHSPELIREAVVKNADSLAMSKRQAEVFGDIYGDNVMTTSDAVWKRQRRILNPGFVPKKIAGYLSLIDDAINDSISRLTTGGAQEKTLVDIDRFATKLTMDVILRVLFGFKASDDESNSIADAVRGLEHQSIRELMWPATPPEWFPYPGRNAKAKNKAILDTVIDSQIKQRRDEQDSTVRKPDYLDMLMKARDEEASSSDDSATLTDKEIHDNCSVIFAAGHDTTAGALVWWIGLMTEYPEYAAKIRQQIEEVIGDRQPTPEDVSQLTWLNASIRETMRKCPSVVALFNRTTTKDIQVGEYVIPKDKTVSVLFWDVHNNPEWYKEPEKFLPERFMPGADKIPKGAYIPFGIGPRVCIGQHLAMLELSMIGIALLRNFDFQFKEGERLPAPKVEMLLKPETPLHLYFSKRAI
ncbi:MAG: cytochrome P450 [Cellvibrionaceae bacterium]